MWAPCLRRPTLPVHPTLTTTPANIPACPSCSTVCKSWTEKHWATMPPPWPTPIPIIKEAVCWWTATGRNRQAAAGTPTVRWTLLTKSIPVLLTPPLWASAAYPWWCATASSPTTAPVPAELSTATVWWKSSPATLPRMLPNSATKWPICPKLPRSTTATAVRFTAPMCSRPSTPSSLTTRPDWWRKLPT